MSGRSKLLFIMSVLEWQSRTALQIGEQNIKKLSRANVLVVGLGGVGAYAAEMIARAGVGSMTIIDADTIQPSNLNRQLSALNSTKGQLKAEIMGRRLLDINPDLNLRVVPEFICNEKMEEILKAQPYNYVVDAIDTLSPKIHLIYHSQQLKLNIVSSMGAGGKSDPSQIKVADIAKSYNCKLARILRKRLRYLGVQSGVKVVYSPEKVSKEAVLLVDDEQNKRSTVGTISYMPPMFGCFCASVVINDLIKG